MLAGSLLLIISNCNPKPQRLRIRLFARLITENAPLKGGSSVAFLPQIIADLFKSCFFANFAVFPSISRQKNIPTNRMKVCHLRPPWGNVNCFDVKIRRPVNTGVEVFAANAQVSCDHAPYNTENHNGQPTCTSPARHLQKRDWPCSVDRSSLNRANQST